MNFKTKLFLTAGAAMILAAPPVWAESSTTQTVTSKTSTVHPDGSVSYESNTVVTKDGENAPGAVVVASARPVTFYYYDVGTKRIVSASDLTEQVFNIWDKDHNKNIDMHEFYDNELVVYEPIEYTKRTYQDVNGDGLPDLTQEEYTVRMQKIPTYGEINTDKKDGISVAEFVGEGFQAVDVDDNNQISYDELKKAFYGQSRLVSNPDLYNK